VTNNSLAANQRPNISLIDRRLCDARRVPYRVRIKHKCFVKKSRRRFRRLTEISHISHINVEVEERAPMIKMKNEGTSSRVPLERLVRPRRT
jgi:hypothetical protein